MTTAYYIRGLGHEESAYKVSFIQATFVVDEDADATLPTVYDDLAVAGNNPMAIQLFFHCFFLLGRLDEILRVKSRPWK